MGIDKERMSDGRRQRRIQWEYSNRYLKAFAAELIQLDLIGETD
ncbi:hypothetical protein GCM10007971_05870 [Oceanobacillus indicireducens]|uniref:Uncharacterized protein n=1 Tax=Oceanobacillus indicireducens TaxID=1004261 RepID=A0A917XSN6_9BACI|nr:hypothetical protein GCM10007971_05870 [Oceanobacillus indicireducens]